MVNDTNRKRGEDWAQYSQFTPTEDFVKDLEQFEILARSVLQPQYEQKPFQGIGARYRA